MTAKPPVSLGQKVKIPWGRYLMDAWVVDAYEGPHGWRVIVRVPVTGAEDAREYDSEVIVDFDEIVAA